MICFASFKIFSSKEFYIKRINKSAIKVDMQACVNFWRQKSEIGIFILDNIVKDCNMVEIPPKLITNVHATAAHIPLKVVEISRQPLVISTVPSRILAI